MKCSCVSHGHLGQIGHRQILQDSAPLDFDLWGCGPEICTQLVLKHC